MVQLSQLVVAAQRGGDILRFPRTIAVATGPRSSAILRPAYSLTSHGVGKTQISPNAVPTDAQDCLDRSNVSASAVGHCLPRAISCSLLVTFPPPHFHPSVTHSDRPSVEDRGNQ